MKKILILLVFCLTMMIGQAQQQKNYPLFADKVVEFGYLVDEDVYYITYIDTTNFPYFQLYEDEYYLEEAYIDIECSREDFFNYLFWFAEEQLKKSAIFYNADSRYNIREIITDVKGGTNHKFYLNNLTKCTH